MSARLDRLDERLRGWLCAPAGRGTRAALALLTAATFFLLLMTRTLVQLTDAPLLLRAAGVAVLTLPLGAMLAFGLRIARERANADRKLRPKKTHTGYVVLTSSEKEYRYKTMRKETAVAGLWETALQSPYSVDFTEEQARALTEELVQPNENSETIVGHIGIDTYYHGSYEDLLHDQRRSGRQAEDLNIMLKPKLRANYKTGYWEVIFLHTSPLGLVPGDMRALRR